MSKVIIAEDQIKKSLKALKDKGIDKLTKAETDELLSLVLTKLGIK